MEAVIPAEVQTPSSSVKMRSTSTLMLGNSLLQGARMLPVRGRTSPLENTRFRKRECARTGRHDAPSDLGGSSSRNRASPEFDLAFPASMIKVSNLPSPKAPFDQGSDETNGRARPSQTEGGGRIAASSILFATWKTDIAAKLITWKPSNNTKPTFCMCYLTLIEY